MLYVLRAHVHQGRRGCDEKHRFSTPDDDEVQALPMSAGESWGATMYAASLAKNVQAGRVKNSRDNVGPASGLGALVGEIASPFSK